MHERTVSGHPPCGGICDELTALRARVAELEREGDEARAELAGCRVDLGYALSSVQYQREASERRAASLRQSAASWRALAEAPATAGPGEQPPAPERHPLSQMRSPRPPSDSEICGSCDGSGMAYGGPCPDCDGYGTKEPAAAWRHDVWLSRLVSALHRAGFGDRVPDCVLVHEDAILAALDDLVAAALVGARFAGEQAR